MKRSYHKWTMEADRVLLKGICAGKTQQEVAKELKRDRGSIYGRLKTLNQYLTKKNEYFVIPKDIEDMLRKKNTKPSSRKTHDRWTAKEDKFIKANRNKSLEDLFISFRGHKGFSNRSIYSIQHRLRKFQKAK